MVRRRLSILPERVRKAGAERREATGCELDPVDASLDDPGTEGSGTSGLFTDFTDLLAASTALMSLGELISPASSETGTTAAMLLTAILVYTPPEAWWSTFETAGALLHEIEDSQIRACPTDHKA
jgi:hypothetical protein